MYSRWYAPLSKVPLGARLRGAAAFFLDGVGLTARFGAVFFALGFGTIAEVIGAVAIR